MAARVTPRPSARGRSRLRKAAHWRGSAAAISPSATTSSRIGSFIGMTEVIGSTPATSTALSASTKERIALISPCRCGSLGVADGDARQMRDAADGGLIDRHEKLLKIASLLKKPPYTIRGFAVATRAYCALALRRMTDAKPLSLEALAKQLPRRRGSSAWTSAPRPSALRFPTSNGASPRRSSRSSAQVHSRRRRARRRDQQIRSFRAHCRPAARLYGGDQPRAQATRAFARNFVARASDPDRVLGRAFLDRGGRARSHRARRFARAPRRSHRQDGGRLHPARRARCAPTHRRHSGSAGGAGSGRGQRLSARRRNSLIRSVRPTSVIARNEATTQSRRP